ncbi:DUF3048 domain-containing protein [Candidatus Woesebacteria bacterium]|nr:DUF3048 domain-containing protein [Candidatus Woesebacteria bacterium]
MKIKSSGSKKTKSLMIVLSFLGLYLISTGVSWAIFSYIKGEPIGGRSLEGIDKTRSEISDLPKTEECPLNGMMYSEPERGIWEERRPLAVIIENSHEARPVEGLHRADIVYEAVAEGGITRFMGVFYCGASAENVRLAPIRSARIYFINWAAEYGKNPIFTHVGGANNFCATCFGNVKPRGQVDPRVMALEELVDLGWRVRGGNDFDTTFDSGYPVFKRDPERLNGYLEDGETLATEHTVTSYTDDLFSQAAERGYNYADSDGAAWNEDFRSWKFKDGSASTSPTANEISFGFWEDSEVFGDLYDVTWKYDSSENIYKREIGGEPQVDRITEEQFVASNVVVQLLDEYTGIDQEKHVFYDTISSGDALVFQNGDVIEGTWEKDSQLDRTIFYDEDGKEIEFVKGVIWIEALPDGNTVNY